jgi:hypothetical protein
MARAVIAPGHGKKRKITITPDPDIFAWVLEQVGPGKRWASVTHAAEFAWARLREDEADKKPARR